MSGKKHGRGTGNPEPVDIYVGAQIRKARGLMGLSQEKLAELVDLTFQQVQKYEKGTNRVSCSRICQIARALKVPIIYFFPDPERGNESELLDRIEDLTGACTAYQEKLTAIAAIAGEK